MITFIYEKLHFSFYHFNTLIFAPEIYILLVLSSSISPIIYLALTLAQYSVFLICFEYMNLLANFETSLFVFKLFKLTDGMAGLPL
jgi:hypothetical protein